MTTNQDHNIYIRVSVPAGDSSRIDPATCQPWDWWTLSESKDMITSMVDEWNEQNTFHMYIIGAEAETGISVRSFTNNNQ